jgi:hypothetical protein
VLLDDAMDGGQAQSGPLPSSLVVKNGSKIRGKCSEAMPVPVSVTVNASV